jgi:hypothetical protein
MSARTQIPLYTSILLLSATDAGSEKSAQPDIALVILILPAFPSQRRHKSESSPGPRFRLT